MKYRSGYFKIIVHNWGLPKYLEIPTKTSESAINNHFNSRTTVDSHLNSQKKPCVYESMGYWCKTLAHTTDMIVVIDGQHYMFLQDFYDNND